MIDFILQWLIVFIKKGCDDEKGIAKKHAGKKMVGTEPCGFDDSLRSGLNNKK